MNYKETILKRLKELPEALRSFILDEKWRADAERIGKQFNLNEEKYASFENEIFVVLLALEPIGDFEENIKITLKLDSNMVGWIAEDVKKSIFDKVSSELNAIWKEIGKAEEKQNEEVLKENQTPKNIENSFEQKISNQAKAMRPAQKAPINLPTEQESEVKTEEKPKATQSYEIGKDPYKEPLN